jgi:hypothetical protein
MLLRSLSRHVGTFFPLDGRGKAPDACRLLIVADMYVTYSCAAASRSIARARLRARVPGVRALSSGRITA